MKKDYIRICHKVVFLNLLFLLVFCKSLKAIYLDILAEHTLYQFRRCVNNRLSKMQNLSKKLIDISYTAFSNSTNFDFGGHILILWNCLTNFVVSINSEIQQSLWRDIIIQYFSFSSCPNNSFFPWETSTEYMLHRLN